MVSSSRFLLSSETHLAKRTMSTSCYAHKKMNPDVRDTEPGAALFSYAEMAVSQIWALSPAVPDSGGPCQSQSSPCLLLEIQDLPAPLASFATTCRSHFSCSFQADLRVEVLQKEKRRTEASFCNTENPRTLPRPKHSVILEDILEQFSCCPLPETRISSSVAVLLSSLEVSVNSREWPSIRCTLWSMENIWHLSLGCVEWRLKLMHQSISCCFSSCYGS